MRRVRCVCAVYLALLLPLLAGCDFFGDGDDSRDERASARTSGATLCLSVDSMARTALPHVDDVQDFTAYTLTGALLGSAGGTESLEPVTWQPDGAYSAYEVMNNARVPVSTGVWQFTLTATKGGATYRGSAQKQIVEGENQLAFTLALVALDTENGRGGIAITLEDFPAAAVDQVTAGLYTTGGVLADGFADEPIAVTDGSVLYGASDIPAGIYVVTFRFYGRDQHTGSSVLLGTWREYANVVDGLVSIATERISYLETLYAISYDDLNDDTGSTRASFADSNTVPGSYSRYSDDIVLPQLVRTGYHFDGWYTDQAFTTPCEMIPGGSVGDVHLHAKWTPITYTVQFEPNVPKTEVNGLSGTTESLCATYDQTDALTTNGYARKGFAFIGWNTQADGSGDSYENAQSDRWNFSATQDSVVTLYAQWKAADATYTVRHFLEQEIAGSYIEDTTAVQQEGGTTGAQTTAAAKTSYQGFTPLPVEQKEVKADGSTEVRIYYDRAVYAIVYEPNAYLLDDSTDTSVSALPDTASFRYQATVTLASAIPVRTGYDFSGWNTQANGGGTAYAAGETLSGTNAADITLYAQWSPWTYTVVFNGRGGTLPDDGATKSYQTFTYDREERLQGNEFLFKGWSFAGWAQFADDTDPTYANRASVCNVTDEKNGTVNLWAVWKEAETDYTVRHYQQYPAASDDANDEDGDGMAGYKLVETSSAYVDADGTSVAYLGTTGAQTDARAHIYEGFESGVVTNVAIKADGSSVATITYDRKVSALSYDANARSEAGTADNSVRGVPDDEPRRYASEAALASAVPVRTGYQFAEWNTQANGGGSAYAPGALFGMPATDVTLYAQWTANAYTVRFNGNGGQTADGTTTRAQTFAYGGENALLANTFTRQGYAFVGWNTIAVPTAATPGETYADGQSVANLTSENGGTVNLYAQWAIIEYTVTLHNAEATTTVSVAYGGTLPDIPVPTKTGYVFGGYFAEPDGAGAHYYSAAGKGIRAWDYLSDKILYAQWTANTYTVRFNGNGGTTADGTATREQTCAYGGENALLANTFVRQGYAFTGWNTLPTPTTANLGETYSDGQSVANLTSENGGTVNLYAQWAATGLTPYTVKHYQQYAAATDDANDEDGDGMAGYKLIETASRYDDAGGNKIAYTGAVGAQTTAVAHTYAGFEPGAVANVVIKADGSSVATVTYDRTLYTLTYDEIAEHVTGCRYESTITLSTVIPTRAGYTFDHWNTQADGTGASYTAGATFTFGTTDVNLYAQWTANAYTVTLNNDGATTTVSVAYGGTLPDIPVPAKTGYVFGGYFAEPDGAGAHYYSAAGKGLRAWDYLSDKILYAQWTANAYTVRFSGNGGATADGTATREQTFAYGGENTLSANTFVRQGYAFTGWNTVATPTAAIPGKAYADGQSVANLTSENGETINLYAQWTANAYTVRFSGNGGATTDGTTTREQTFAYGGENTLSANTFTRQGYAFTGWNTVATPNSANPGKAYADGQSVANLTSENGGTINLYAQWTSNAYTVRFRGNGGATADGKMAREQTFAYGSEKTLSANAFVRQGYAFTGWNTVATPTSANPGKAYADGQSVANLTSENGGTINLYAQWTANTYTVTLNNDGATTTVSATYGSTLPDIPVPAKTGYVFGGYFAEPDGAGAQYYSSAGKGLLTWDYLSDKILYARWIPAETTAYTVRHYQQYPAASDDANDEDGDGVAGYKLVETSSAYAGTTGAQTDARANTYEGFESGVVTNVAIKADGSSVATVTYDRKICTVSYAAGSGISATNIPAAENHRFGTAANVSATIPTRTGYTFIGWQKSGDSTTTYSAGANLVSEINADIALVAVWSKTQFVDVSLHSDDLTATVSQSGGTSVTITAGGNASVSGYTWLIYYTASTGWIPATADPVHGTVSIDGKTLTIDTSDWTSGTYQFSVTGLSGSNVLYAASGQIVVVN